MEPHWLAPSRDAFAGEPDPARPDVLRTLAISILISLSCIGAYVGFIVWGLS